MSNLTGRKPYQKGQSKPKTRKGLRKVSAKKAAEKHPLRDNAKGKECQLKLAGCRNDPKYTVLCHVRRNGWGGMGAKPNDLLAFFACDICHEKQERHSPDCSDSDILRAVGRTLLIQQSDGLIKS